MNAVLLFVLDLFLTVINLFFACYIYLIELATKSQIEKIHNYAMTSLIRYSIKTLYPYDRTKLLAKKIKYKVNYNNVKEINFDQDYIILKDKVIPIVFNSIQITLATV